MHHSGNKRLFLLEVESARKPNDELMRFLSLTNMVGTRVHPERPCVLAGIFIVYAEPTTLQIKLLLLMAIQTLER